MVRALTSSYNVKAPRSGSIEAIVAPPELPLDALLFPPVTLTDTPTFLLAGIQEALGGVGYGGKSAFSETVSGESGDLNQVIAIGLLFPTLVTGAFFKDSIMEAFEPDMYSETNLPPGWKQVPSQSRPGQFSYLNTATNERFDKLPGAAKKGNM